jgi:hypothetical protein
MPCIAPPAPTVGFSSVSPPTAIFIATHSELADAAFSAFVAFTVQPVEPLFWSLPVGADTDAVCEMNATSRFPAVALVMVSVEATADPVCFLLTTAAAIGRHRLGAI